MAKPAKAILLIRCGQRAFACAARALRPDEPVFSGVIAWRGVIDAGKLPGARSAAGANWVGPGAHVIHYPLRGDRLVSFVGAIENRAGKSNHGPNAARSTNVSPTSKANAEDVRTLISAIDIPYKWALMVREPMARWARPQGRCSAMPSVRRCRFSRKAPAWRSKTAISLGRCLERYTHTDVPQALQRYEALRLRHTAKVDARGSAANATTLS